MPGKLSWMESIRGFTPIGSHVDGTEIDAAVVLTPETGARKVMLQALTKDIRYTLDGTTPEATVGFQLTAGNPAIVLDLTTGIIITVIEVAATADLQIQWGA
jgi:hypothetical protein